MVKIVLIGDVHTDENVAKKIANFIRRERPDLVLYEGANFSFESEKIKNIFEYSTLEKILEKIPNKEKVLEDFKKFFEKVNFEKYLYNWEGYLPKNIKELMETPIYEFNPDFLIDLIFSITDTNSMKIIYDYASRFIVRRLKDIKTKENVKYNFYLILEAVKEIDSRISGFDYSEKKNNVLNEAAKNEDIIKSLEILSNYLKNERLEYDEIKMAEGILQNIRKYKPKKVFVIVGERHLRKDSNLKKKLDEYGLKYEEVIFDNRKEGEIMDSLSYSISLILSAKNEYTNNQLRKS